MLTGIREKLAKKPWIAGSAAALVTAVALAYALHSGSSELGDKPYLMNTYYSTDDGASYFPGEGKNYMTMERQSPPAFEVAVFNCGGKTFVGYLKRLPEQQIKVIEAAQQQADKDTAALSSTDPKFSEKSTRITDKLQAVTTAALSKLEVKRPGATNQWVQLAGPEGQEVQNVKCPGSPSMIPVPYLPPN